MFTRHGLFIHLSTKLEAFILSGPALPAVPEESKPPSVSYPIPKVEKQEYLLGKVSKMQKESSLISNH